LAEARTSEVDLDAGRERVTRSNVRIAIGSRCGGSSSAIEREDPAGCP
jgi:hypothetical protein